MEKIAGNIINELPFGKLTKVADLVYYECPILTHFVSEKGVNMLFHWIDYDENFNRWLVIQVDKEEMYDYLKNEKSLHDLFNNTLNCFVFIVDIDKNTVYKKIYFVTSKELNTVYVPDKESYFNLEIPQYYLNEIEQNKPYNYFAALKENAYYLKLKSIKEPLENTLNTENVINFLKNITDSVINFAEVKIKKSSYFFKDDAKLRALLRENLTPKFVDAKIGSFCVGIAIDPVQKETNCILTEEWRKDFFNEYNNDVIDADVDNVYVLKRITEKYNPTERYKIYDPFIKAIKNKNYYVVKTNRFNQDINKFKSLSLKKEEILLPTETKIKEELKVTDRFAKVKVEEGGKIKQKDITLFDLNINSVLYTFNEIKYEDKTYKLKRQLNCRYEELEDGVTNIENNDLGIFAQGSSREDAIAMFSEEFDFIYNRYNELPEEKLTDDVVFIKQYLNNIVIK